MYIYIYIYVYIHMHTCIMKNKHKNVNSVECNVPSTDNDILAGGVPVKDRGRIGKCNGLRTWLAQTFENGSWTWLVQTVVRGRDWYKLLNALVLTSNMTVWGHRSRRESNESFLVINAWRYRIRGLQNPGPLTQARCNAVNQRVEPMMTSRIRTSLSGSPRANALTKTCSSIVTY